MRAYNRQYIQGLEYAVWMLNTGNLSRHDVEKTREAYAYYAENQTEYPSVMWFCLGVSNALQGTLLAWEGRAESIPVW